MSISVQVADITRVRDLFVLYGKKGAFNLEEYSDVGAVYKNVTRAIEDANDANEVELTKKDVTYVANAINVCSQRTAVEVQNYKPISILFDTLTALLKEDDEAEVVEVETKKRK